MGSNERFQQHQENPFLIDGLKFFKDPEAKTRSGNRFADTLSNDYHNDLKTGYHIPFVSIGRPENRKLKVITIGAGFSGILLAYNIEKFTSNVDHKIYEKNSDVGGTWSPYLHAYLSKVANKLDLRRYMNFNSRVTKAQFDKDRGVWELNIEQTLPDGSIKSIIDECDLLLGAVGILDRWEYPKIKGLEKFRGRVIHTADREKWEEYTPDKWSKEDVVVIGSGASSIQTVPGMQPQAQKLHVFIRTPPWFFTQSEKVEGEMRPQGYKYTKEEKEHFATDLSAMLHHSKVNENHLNMLHHVMIKHNPAYRDARETLTNRTRAWIKDDKIFNNIIPKFSVGCRRIAPGDPYMVAIQQPNVQAHFCGITEVVEDGVIGDDGRFTSCDTIVCATGFDVSYRPPFPLVGLDDLDLREEWHSIPASYFGLMAPKIPNYLMYIGPNSPVESGSILAVIDAVVKYTIKCIKKMQFDNIKYFVPKQEVTNEFNLHTQSWFKGTVWEEDCNAWYKNRKTRRVDAVWPGSVLHYREAIENPRWEDMEIAYHNAKSRFQYLGYGYSELDLNPDKNADRSRYLTLENLDPRFYKD